MFVSFQVCDRAAELYQYFKHELGTKFSIGDLDLPGNRLVDMFVQVTDRSTKEIILKQMTSRESTLRVLICSVAFGMGVDVKGVERVIHDDAPHTLEEYVQEMGRAARECNLQGHALLLYHSLKGREDAMKTYCLSQSCLRCQIGKYFEAEASQLPLHNCCCMCRGTSVSSCSCLVCTATKYKLGAVQISASEGHSRDELTDSQKQRLRQQLEEIGANSSKIRFPAGASCPVQITNKDIKEIVSFAHNIDNVEQLESIVHVWDDHMAKAIVDAISMFYS